MSNKPSLVNEKSDPPSENASSDDTTSDNLDSPLPTERFPCVAGHGNILYGTDGTLYKIMNKSNNEYLIYKHGVLKYSLFFDLFVPKFYGKRKNMLKLQDL